MQSLTDLNNRAATPITFTENRGTNVIFDRAAGKQYNFTETSLSFDLLVGANIVEIINPSIANVRYKVNLGTTQASLSYGTLPAGVTVNQVGTVYTFYGIDSVSDWEAIKQLTVVIDPAFAGNFSYSAAVVYNTDAQADVEFEWNIGIYLPDAQLSASASLSCAPSYFQGGIANLISFFGLAVEGVKVLGSVFNMVTNANRFARTGATMSINSTIVAKPRTYTFTDSTTTVDSPYPDDGDPTFGAQFGKYIAVAGSNVIASFDSSDSYSAFAINMNGSIEYEFPRQTTGGAGVFLAASPSGNFVCTIEEKSGTNDVLHLYKKQNTGDLYTHVDSETLTQSDVFDHSRAGMSEDYVIIRESFSAQTVGFKNKVKVFSLDATSGITLEYNHTGGVDSSGNFGDNIGEIMAINDDYYVWAKMNESGSTGNHDEIYVYDTATGTLQHTLNSSTTSAEVRGCTLEGNDLIVTFDNGDLITYDISTGTEVNNTNITITNATIVRYYDDVFVAAGSSGSSKKMYNLSNGNEESDLSLQSNVTDFAFKGTDTLIEGDYLFGGLPYEGRVLIRKET